MECSLALLFSDVFSIAQCMGSNGNIKNQRLIMNNSKGSGRGLICVLFGHVPQKIEEPQ
jgi:hypothetical protein